MNMVIYWSEVDKPARLIIRFVVGLWSDGQVRWAAGFVASTHIWYLLTYTNRETVTLSSQRLKKASKGTHSGGKNVFFRPFSKMFLLHFHISSWSNFWCIAFNKTNTIANMIIMFIAKRFDASRWGGGSDGHLYDFAKRCQIPVTAKWKLHTLCLSDTSILAKLGWCNVYIGWEALLEKYLRMDTFPRTSLSDV